MAGDHKCPVCSATFTRPQHVARHMRSHTGDRPYKCQHCGDQFARSDLLSRHVNKCHASEKPPTTTAPNRRKGSASASRATTSKQACDQCVVTNLPCDGSNPCSKCISRKCRCTYVKFHRQTAPVGPGHPAPSISSTEKTSQHPHFSVDAIMPSDEYLLTQPQNPTVPLSNMGSVGIYHHNTMPATEFTFPAPMYSRSSSLPVNTTVTNSQSAPDQTSPDFAIRYRAQAELLSRAGVLPHSQITLPSSVGQGSAHSNSRIGLGLNSGIATQSSQHQSYNSDQRYSLSSASWGNGRQPQEPMNGIIYHSSRPNSQAGYPGSLPNNSASSAPDLYDFRYANRDSVDDLSDSTSASTSELGHSEHGHSSDHSFYDSPSIPQTVPTNLIISGQKPSSEHHEGFSSAFGLMSLDDPNVLAGIASDGTPFFSNINGNGQSEMNTIPQHMRDDAMAGICLKPLSTKLDGLNELNGNVGGGSTPRETELRELRDFWKQYMRTPLSGPNGSGPTTNGFPLATPTPNNLHGHGQLEEQTGKHSPTKKLSRVSSLPSVKTPPSHSEVGPLGHPPANSQHIYHAIVSNETGRSNIAADPSRAGTYIHTQMGEDDLKSYEQAVLARKTPTLNLVPRKRPTTANTVDSSSFGRFSNPSTASSSPVVPQQSLGGAGRTSSLSDPATSSRPSSADSDESDRGAITRPSFKRLPSTTLGPPNSKRALLSVSRHEWSSTSDAEALRVTEGSDADCGGGILRGVFISEPSSTMADTPVQAVAAREKHRRLSAPVATNSPR